MAIDLPQQIIQATVLLEQPLAGGERQVGTGFLISAPGPNGRTRTVLVTASHVFETMPGPTAHIGYRFLNKDGSWTYTPKTLKIRDAAGHELWTHHPARDVAAIAITAPPEFAKAAIPEDYLASEETLVRFHVGTGDEMLVLGFPHGLSANSAGFPILRSGRVASYPMTPAAIFPTFLLDFTVFPGNSGGPVYMSVQSRRRPGQEGTEEGAFIAGVVTQELELNTHQMELGIVTQAKFIRETVDLALDPNAAFTGPVATAVSSASERAVSPETALAPK